jgi:hypothetical protein
MGDCVSEADTAEVIAWLAGIVTTEMSPKGGFAKFHPVFSRAERGPPLPPSVLFSGRKQYSAMCWHHAKVLA